MSKTVGRYAPSPTGALHFGSLLAALASFCHAKARGGQWRLRIDDLDATRVVAGADREIIQTLAAFGLVHDGPVMYQSTRAPAYARALAELMRKGLAFDCACTRREARAKAKTWGIEGPIYPGTCRSGRPPDRPARSVRLKVASGRIGFTDQIQGRYDQNLARDIGDFVVRRGDGITAYQLATVVDDAAQGVTEIVRGADLLSSTPRQLWIYRGLGLTPRPSYAHIPVVTDSAGAKLSKSTGALALSRTTRSAQLAECLTLLGQNPPIGLASQPVSTVIGWALAHWSVSAVPRRTVCERETPRPAATCFASDQKTTTALDPSARGWPSSES